jgi:xylose dehydrogenase (NAD/NADP)
LCRGGSAQVATRPYISIYSRIRFMPKKLRWGVIGTGRIADQLVRAWELSNTNELAAIASRDNAKAQEWANKNHAVHAFDSYEKMLASDVIDAVYIPLPNGLHKEWTVKAAQAGKHVLCEKPLADNAAQVEEIIAARDANHVTIMEAFMYRFHPKTLKWQAMVRSGAVGDLKIIRASFTFFLRTPRNIRMDSTLAGGVLMDLGCYPVSISRMVADAEPTAVYCRAVWGEDAGKVTHDEARIRTLTSDDAHLVGVDHTMSAVMEFPNHVLAVVDWSFTADSHQWLSIAGTHGHIGVTAPFRMGEEEQVILYDHENKHEDVMVPGANEYHKMVDHFAETVLQGKPISYTLENSLGQARTIDALYQSARTGLRVTM